MSDWYYAVDGQQRGPVSDDALKQMLAAGQLGASDLVWREGMTDWISASTFLVLTSEPPRPAEPDEVDMPSPDPGLYEATGSPGTLSYHRALPAQYGMMSHKPLSWMGIILLVAFFLPILERGWKESLVFPNIYALIEKGVPLAVRLLALYPLLGGLAMLIIAYNVRGAARGATTLAIAAVPLLIAVALVVADEDAMEAIGEMGGPLFGSVIRGLVGGLAFMGLLVGSWVWRYRPGAQAAAVLVGVGGALFILSLFIPTSDMRTGRTTIPLIAMFTILGTRGMPLSAIVLLGFQILVNAILAIASILGLMVLANRRAGNSRARSIFAMIVSVVAIQSWSLLLLLLSESRDGNMLFLFLVMLKVVSSLVALVLPFAVGLTDLLVSVIPKPQQQALSLQRSGIYG